MVAKRRREGILDISSSSLVFFFLGLVVVVAVFKI